MRNLQFLIVFGIILAVYGMLNYYIGLKGWNTLGRYLPFLDSRIYWVFFWGLVLAYPAARMGEPYLPVSVARWMTVAGAYWLAAMFYFVLLALVAKPVLILDRWFSFLPAALRGPGSLPAAGGLVFLLVVLILIYGTWNALSPKISRYQINVGQKAGNLERLKIVAVSDIHLGAIVRTKRLVRLAEIIDKLEPDLVVLAGDIVDQTIEPEEARQLVDIFSRMKTTYGIYAVPGNHEYISGFIDKTAYYFEKAGVRYLRDEVVKVADSFYVVGREDLSRARFGREERRELSRLMFQVDEELPVILVDHQPVDLEKAQKLGVDLQISGHTHRGQLWPNHLITGRIYENDWGLLKKGPYHLVVSSGFGTWGPPIRTGSRCEVVEITVNFSG